MIMKNRSLFRIMLVTVVIVPAVLLIAARNGRKGDVPGAMHPDEVLNERGFWGELLDITPEPITDCAGVREWLAEHPRALYARVQRAQLTAELTYRPGVCTACLELPDAALVDAAVRDRMATLSNGGLYALRFAVGTDPAAHHALRDTLQAYIVEVIGTDTLPCAFMHVETMPPGVPYSSAIIGFDRAQDRADRRIIIRDPHNAFGGDVTLALPLGASKALAEAIDPNATRP